MTLVVLAHLAATLFLTGMIWTIQVVHYPLFTHVGTDRFVDYEADHSRRIAGVIALPWAVQGVTTAALLVRQPPNVSFGLVAVAAVLAAIPVAVTVAISVPAHAVLGRGFDPDAHGRLVRTNWWRTAAWTTHSVVALVIASAALRQAT